MLTQEERNDLRKKVLRGEDLTLDEARAVHETLRSGQAAAIAEQGKAKRVGRRAGVSDEQLDKDLASLGF